jgi:hypothetical protein
VLMGMVISNYKCGLNKKKIRKRMPLTHCTEQKRQTLDEFYSEWASSDDKISSDTGKAMLTIINLINRTFLNTKIYGLTSHAHLLLFSQDNCQTKRHLSIIANGQEFHIEYLLPKEKQPWTNATVRGTTNSIEEFRKYIIIGMAESLGWEESSELMELYQRIKNIKE